MPTPSKIRVCLMAVILLAVSDLRSAQRSADPAQVKSAYLIALSRYTEWPASAFKNASSPIQITVLGEDTLGSWLDQTVAGKTARGRKFAIRRVKDIKNLDPTHILFVSESVPNAPELLAQLGVKPLLIVSDQADFLEQGGGVQFLPSRPFVTFGVNLDAIHKAGLKINSKVLDSARKIIRKGRVSTR